MSMITVPLITPTNLPSHRHNTYSRHSLGVVLSLDNERKNMGCESKRFAAFQTEDPHHFSINQARCARRNPEGKV